MVLAYVEAIVKPVTVVSSSIVTAQFVQVLSKVTESEEVGFAPPDQLPPVDQSPSPDVPVQVRAVANVLWEDEKNKVAAITNTINQIPFLAKIFILTIEL